MYSFLLFSSFQFSVVLAPDYYFGLARFKAVEIKRGTKSSSTALNLASFWESGVLRFRSQPLKSFESLKTIFQNQTQFYTKSAVGIANAKVGNLGEFCSDLALGVAWVQLSGCAGCCWVLRCAGWLCTIFLHNPDRRKDVFVVFIMLGWFFQRFIKAQNGAERLIQFGRLWF